MDVFTAAFSKLQVYAEAHESVLVAFSGGKDSRVILDMATRLFRRVVCFYLYFVPDLAVEERNLAIVKERYKVPLLRYPSPIVFETIKAELYTDCPQAWDGFSWTMEDAYNLARLDSGCDLVITGRKYSDAVGQGLTYKKSDAEQEERIRRNQSSVAQIREFHPLAKWNKWHVLSYLQSRGIPVPESDGRNSASIELAVDCIFWLHDEHPEDFQKMCRVFRYLPAMIERRRLYGVC